MTSPTFAITIPIGPQPSKWLDWTLRSLSTQHVETRLAICSVNESADLKERLKPYANQIAYERFGPDAGQSDAINEGWKAVEADIYGWLNDDDCLAPGTLDKVAKIFSDHPDIDVVFGDTVLVENDRFTRLHPGPRKVDDTLYRDNLISQPSCFVRKDTLFDVGLLENDRHYTMDWDLWVRLYKAGKGFHYLQETLSLVRHYAETKTASLNVQRLSEIFGIVRENSGWRHALHTAFNFSIFHLAEYGPFKTIFGMVKARFCEPPKARRNSVQDFTLFHYQDAPCTAITVEWDLPALCEIYLNGQTVFEGKAARFEQAINLAESESLNLRIEYKSSGGEVGQTIQLT